MEVIPQGDNSSEFVSRLRLLRNRYSFTTLEWVWQYLCEKSGDYYFRVGYFENPTISLECIDNYPTLILTYTKEMPMIKGVINTLVDRSVIIGFNKAHNVKDQTGKAEVTFGSLFEVEVKDFNNVTIPISPLKMVITESCILINFDMVMFEIANSSVFIKNYVFEHLSGIRAVPQTISLYRHSINPILDPKFFNNFLMTENDIFASFTTGDASWLGDASYGTVEKIDIPSFVDNLVQKLSLPFYKNYMTEFGSLNFFLPEYLHDVKDDLQYSKDPVWLEETEIKAIGSIGKILSSMTDLMPEKIFSIPKRRQSILHYILEYIHNNKIPIKKNDRGEIIVEITQGPVGQQYSVNVPLFNFILFTPNHFVTTLLNNMKKGKMVIGMDFKSKYLLLMLKSYIEDPMEIFHVSKHANFSFDNFDSLQSLLNEINIAYSLLLDLYSRDFLYQHEDERRITCLFMIYFIQQWYFNFADTFDLYALTTKSHIMKNEKYFDQILGEIRPFDESIPWRTHNVDDNDEDIVELYNAQEINYIQHQKAYIDVIIKTRSLWPIMRKEYLSYLSLFLKSFVVAAIAMSARARRDFIINLMDYYKNNTAVQDIDVTPESLFRLRERVAFRNSISFLPTTLPFMVLKIWEHSDLTNFIWPFTKEILFPNKK
jgi:hypothetical protein